MCARARASDTHRSVGYASTIIDPTDCSSAQGSNQTLLLGTKGFHQVPIVAEANVSKSPNLELTGSPGLQCRLSRVVLSSKSQVSSSKFQVPSSKFQAPSSKLQAKLQVPSSELHVPSFKFQAPSSKFQVPNSKLQNPNSKFQVASSKLQVSSSSSKLQVDA